MAPSREELLRRVADLEGRVHELERLALTDPLTGLPNRRAVEGLAAAEVRRRTRYPSPLALGLVDVDHFHDLNARHTLTGGDAALVALARVLAASVRAADSVGRYGGDEFLLLAPQTGAGGARALGERLRRATAGVSPACTVSLGFAVAEAGTPAGLEDLTALAARALQEAKAEGRDRVVVHVLPWPDPDAKPG